jgi:hypothetical protein
MLYLEQAIKDGYAHITGAEGKRQITYVSSDNHKERYDDPIESYFKGNFGQYFTPRPIIEFSIVNPRHHGVRA